MVFSLFLNIGTTFASFMAEGKTLVSNDKFATCANGTEIDLELFFIQLGTNVVMATTSFRF